MVRTLVANGLGISLLTTRPARDVTYDGKRLVCKDLHGSLPTQSVALAYPPDEDQQPALTAAWAHAAAASFNRPGATPVQPLPSIE